MIKNNIKGIIITGDLLRIGNAPDIYFSKSTIQWIYNLFSYQIELATGIKPIIVDGEKTSLFDRDKFYQLNNLCASQDSWIKLALGNTSNKSKKYFKNSFQNYLIVTHHSNKAFLDIMDELDIPYIDIFESSIRFYEDLVLSFRTNSNKVREQLLKYKMPESKLKIYANYLRAYYQRRGGMNYNKDSLLFIGQTEVDLALIKNGNIVSFDNFTETLKSLFSYYTKIYYKPHPYANKTSKEILYFKNNPNVEFIEDNIYKLLSSNQITGVAALSSGVLEEAKYFEKKVHIISHKYVNYYDKDNENSRDFILLENSYFSPVFWKNVLSPILKVNNVDDFHFNNSHNILRESLNSYWGYELKNFSKSNETLHSKTGRDNSFIKKIKKVIKKIEEL